MIIVHAPVNYILGCFTPVQVTSLSIASFIGQKLGSGFMPNKPGWLDIYHLILGATTAHRTIKDSGHTFEKSI